MKLLLINTTCNWGSTGRLVEAIADIALNEGWETCIAHGSRYVNPSKHSTYRIGTRFGNYLHVLESMFLGNHGNGSRMATKRLISKIESLSPDVIHLHNIHGYYLNYNLLFRYLRECNIPIVWTLHDCWPFTGHCTHFDHIGCIKWLKQCSECPLIHSDYKSLVFDRSFRNYSNKKSIFTDMPNLTIITVSKWLQSIVAKSFLGDYPIKVIYNGIDIKLFKPTSSDIKNRLGIKNKILLMAAATDWNKNKGLYDYIKLRNVLSEDYCILLVGVSPKVKKKLPSSILTLEITQDQKALVELYSAADIILNLSYLETFGLTTIEGMACGTPCIVYDRTASPELVTDKTGIVVSAGNISELAQAVYTIIDRGKETYTHLCREYVFKNFNLINQYNQYIDLYNNVLSK